MAGPFAFRRHRELLELACGRCVSAGPDLEFRLSYRRLLANPEFRRFFMGGVASSLGGATTDLAVVLLSIELAGDDAASVIALATAAYLVPALVTGLAGGRFYDWCPDVGLVVLDSVNRFLCLGAIAILSLLDSLTPAYFVLLLSIAATTKPAGAAGEKGLIRLLVQRAQYLQANSLIQGGDQLSNMVGPALAGTIAALASPAYVFAIASTSFLIFAVAVASLGFRRSTQTAATMRRDAAFPGREITRRPPPSPNLGLLFGLTFLFFFLYGPFIVAFPLYLGQLGLEEDSVSVTLGAAWSAFGVGSVLGVLCIGLARPKVSPVVLGVIAGAWGLLSGSLLFTESVPVVLVLMFLLGLIYSPYGPFASTLLQTQYGGARFGTIMGYWSATTGASAAMGLAAGALALGAGNAPPGTVLGASGLACIAVGIAFLRPLSRWVPHNP
jgi:DHA3 family macrolide efflux protein-like MFS transporter